MSDLGAFRPYGFRARVASDRLPLVRSIQSVLEPLGIAWHGTEASGGADVGQLRELCMPVVDIVTDAAPYFDLHHTVNDTFDKVDPALVRTSEVSVIFGSGAKARERFGIVPRVPFEASLASAWRGR